jgi:glycosyltransferase involved in cell wall biosynthesis
MTGARMHYAVPRLLYEAGLLKRFYTDAYIGNKPVLEWLLRHVPGMSRMPAIARWLGRKDPIIPGQLVSSFDSFTFRQTWLRRGQEGNIARILQLHADGNKAFNEWVIGQGIEGCSAIYGLNRNSLEVFGEAKKHGITCILEQCSVPRLIEVQLLAEEIEKWPDWDADLIPPPQNDPLIRREEEEWQLADRVIAPSESVIKSLAMCGFESDETRLVPYGIDTSAFALEPKTNLEPNRKLRILYVGRVSIMKGIQYLLEAFRMLDTDALEARLVGSIHLEEAKTKCYERWATFMGHIPRREMKDVLAWADIAIMPSLSEGSSIFVLEAIASGVPVIATESSGTVIRDGIDGFVVADRSSEALATAIHEILDNRQILKGFQERLSESRALISLEAYQERLTKEILDS